MHALTETYIQGGWKDKANICVCGWVNLSETELLTRYYQVQKKILFFICFKFQSCISLASEK